MFWLWLLVAVLIVFFCAPLFSSLFALVINAFSKNKIETKTKIAQVKQLRYGSTSTAITLLVTAVVILFNAMFSDLAGKNLWYSDMTSASVFSLSDDAIAYLDTVDAPIDIYFATEEDKLMDGTYNEYTRYVYQTARLMAERYDNINVECHNVYKEYDFFKPYASTLASSIPVTSVIVKSGSEFRLIALDAFYIFDENYQNI